MEKNNLLKTLFYGSVVFLAFIFIISPLLHGGFFPTFDDVQVVRIDQMARELIHGQFPVRYANDLGNGGGYMLFNFYSPLVYYIGSFIHLIGFSLVKSTKLVFILGYLIGALSMFFILRKRVNLLSSVLGTTLFLLSAFLSYEVYVRGTLAEFFGIAILPLCFGLILWFKERPTILKSVFLGLTLGLLVYAHIFVAINAVLLGFVIFIFPPFSRKQYIFGGLALLIGALVSMSFWLPSLLEVSNTLYSASYFGINSYKTNLLSIPQLLGFQNILWGFKPPILGISISVGMLIVIIVLIFLRKKNYLILGSLTACLISLFFASDLSRFLWDSNNFLKMLQFPWRFLAGATVAGVFAISLFVNELKSKLAFVVFLGLILLALSNNSYFRPLKYNYIAVYTADDICSTTTWASEYLPKWTNVCLPKPKKAVVPLVASVEPGVKIYSTKESNYGRVIYFNVENQKNSQILIRRYYFPGWNVFIDNNKVNIKPSGKNGLIAVVVPSGTHSVKAVWQGTLVENVSNWISLVTFCAVLIFLLSYKKLKRLL
jgi:uncharacterized membrane protein